MPENTVARRARRTQRGNEPPAAPEEDSARGGARTPDAGADARQGAKGGRARAVWSGWLELGRLSIPVKLYSAARDELPLRLLHRTDLAPVRYERVCTADGKVLAWDEVVKGYEYEGGKFAPLEAVDFARARGVEVAGPRIDVAEFVPREALGPTAFGTPYLVAPARGGERAYAALREALARTDRVGVVRLTIRDRPYLAALYAERDALGLAVLRTASALVGAADVGVPSRAARPDEAALATALVEAMTVPWDPTRYRDEYRARLRALVERRVPGARGRAAAPSSLATGAGLVAALRRSLAAEGVRPQPAAKRERARTRDETTERPRRAAKRRPRSAHKRRR